MPGPPVQVSTARTDEAASGMLAPLLIAVMQTMVQGPTCHCPRCANYLPGSAPAEHLVAGSNRIFRAEPPRRASRTQLGPGATKRAGGPGATGGHTPPRSILSLGA